MKLSVLANLYGEKTLDQTLSTLRKLGVDTVEIGAGGYPGKKQCDPADNGRRRSGTNQESTEFLATAVPVLGGKITGGRTLRRKFRYDTFCFCSHSGSRG